MWGGKTLLKSNMIDDAAMRIMKNQKKIFEAVSHLINHFFTFITEFCFRFRWADGLEAREISQKPRGWDTCCSKTWARSLYLILRLSYTNTFLSRMIVMNLNYCKVNCLMAKTQTLVYSTRADMKVINPTPVRRGVYPWTFTPRTVVDISGAIQK